MIYKCLEDGIITKMYADNLTKQYLPLFLPYIDNKAKRNGKPSGLVKLVEESFEPLRIRGYSTAHEHENSIYFVIAAMFEKHGVKKNGRAISHSSIRNWIEK
jgi:hypothetical protein